LRRRTYLAGIAYIITKDNLTLGESFFKMRCRAVSYNYHIAPGLTFAGVIKQGGERRRSGAEIPGYRISHRVFPPGARLLSVFWAWITPPEKKRKKTGEKIFIW